MNASKEKKKEKEITYLFEDDEILALPRDMEILTKQFLSVFNYNAL